MELRASRSTMRHAFVLGMGGRLIRRIISLKDILDYVNTVNDFIRQQRFAEWMLNLLTENIWYGLFRTCIMGPNFLVKVHERCILAQTIMLPFSAMISYPN